MQADFIKEEIVKCPLAAESAQDAILKLGKLLLEAGYIKAEYISSICYIFWVNVTKNIFSDVF